MKTLVNILRIFVGSLFIFSGLVKINDPIGFSFKLEEYFGPTVFDIDFLMPYTLSLAIFIVILEVLLGLFLLIGFKPKQTIWVMLLMIIWFTFLTWYSAYYNKVTDCGCFGDAIPLTPWESFTKDVFLLSFILIILYKIELIKPIINFKNQIKEKYEKHIAWLKGQDHLTRATKGYESALDWIFRRDKQHQLELFFKNTNFQF